MCFGATNKFSTRLYCTKKGKDFFNKFQITNDKDILCDLWILCPNLLLFLPSVGTVFLKKVVYNPAKISA